MRRLRLGTVQHINCVNHWPITRFHELLRDVAKADDLSPEWRMKIIGLVQQALTIKMAHASLTRDGIAELLALYNCHERLGDDIPPHTSFNDWINRQANEYLTNHPEEDEGWSGEGEGVEVT